jgi:hypothetical protein
MKFSITTLTTLMIMTLNIMTFNKMTPSMASLSVMTLDITKNANLSITYSGSESRFW